MGYFTAEKPKGDEEHLSITAYDRMVKTERACFLELPDSTNTVAVLKGVGTITGVEVVTEGLTAIPMKKPVATPAGKCSLMWHSFTEDLPSATVPEKSKSNLTRTMIIPLRQDVTGTALPIMTCRLY